MRRLSLIRELPVVAAILLVPRAASACPVCFGTGDAPILRGSNAGILALLVVTLTVLAAFGAFFRALAKRAGQFTRAENVVVDLASSQSHRGTVAR